MPDTALLPAEIAQIRRDVGRVILDQVCDIERNIGGTDAYGHQSVNWQAHLENLPCHLLTITGSEGLGTINVEQTKDYVNVPFDTDVTNNDRIEQIRNQNGEVIGSNYRIEAVVKRPSHILLYVRSDNA